MIVTPRSIPVPFLRQPVPLGQAIESVTSALKIKPCSPCEQRARLLDRLLLLRPIGGQGR